MNQTLEKKWEIWFVYAHKSKGEKKGGDPRMNKINFRQGVTALGNTKCGNVETEAGLMGLTSSPSQGS